MAKAGKNALIKIFNNDAPTTFTDEATTTTDSKNYTITNTSKAIWDPFYTVVVKDGGTPTVESYTVNRLTGTITFGTATSRTITVSGKYLTLLTQTAIHEFTFSISADILDNTEFYQNNGYTSKQRGLLDVSFSFNRYTSNSPSLEGALIAAPYFMVDIYSDNALSFDFRAWCLVSGVEDSSSADALVDSSIDCEGTNDADYRCVT